MRTKIVVAIVTSCAAAGVLSYDVHYFLRPSPAPRGTAPVEPSDSLRGDASRPMLADPADEGAANEQAPSRDFDFKNLFDQLAARDAETAAQRASRDGASVPSSADDDLVESLQGRSGSAADAWSRLELRGTLVGPERALALVNGRMLAVGDELPGVRYRIDRILADRVIAVTAGGSTRALTLHRFESPNKKANLDWNTPRANAPASSVDGNGSAGAGTTTPPAGTPAAAGAKGDQP